MTTNEGKGRSRKRNSARRRMDRVKKAIVYLVCISLIGSGIPLSMVMAAGEGVEAESESGYVVFSMTLDNLCDSIEDAVNNGDPLEEGKYVFSGDNEEDYETLFDTGDGLLYEVVPEVSNDRTGDLSLKTFIRVDKDDLNSAFETKDGNDESEDSEDDSDSEEDTDLNGTDASASYYNVTGNEEIIFLFINDSNNEEYVAARITGSDDDIYQTPVISVPAKGTSITLQSRGDSSLSSGTGISSSSHTAAKSESGSDADKLETASDEISEAIISEASNNTKVAAASLTVSESDSDATDNIEETEELESATGQTSETAAVSDSSGSFSSSSVSAANETSANAIRTFNISEDYIILNGEVYDPVKVNGDSAVAFVTTLAEMGISYGIKTLANEGEGSGKVVLNLGNGNGKYNNADYTHNRQEGTLLRYTTDSLAEYAGNDGKVTINLPSDNNLNSTFTVVDAKDSLSKVTVDLGSDLAYDYKLVGWVNIATGEYYDVSNAATTATIDLSNDNVFYADWIAATYDHGSENDKNLRDDTVSTKGFVTIHMYDYNDLFNLYSESLVQNKDTDGTLWEAWTDSKSLYNNLNHTGTPAINSFIFVNNGTVGYSSTQGEQTTGGMLTWPNYKTNGNTWTGTGKEPRNATDIWGITSPDSVPLNMLFDQNSSALGVYYVGEGDYLFWIDEDGYYIYNSKKAAAAYNQTNQRFYVYDDVQNVTNTSFSCFLPYNTYGESLNAVNGTVNYFFGMDMEVDFYLPNNTGTEGGNKVDGKDMVFNFSGDDDILIFIDDELVLDMSGIHDESFGSINFSEGTVTMGMSTDDAGNILNGTTTEISLSAGSHDLKVYYLERGGYASNLEIQFNVASIWDYMTGDVRTITAEKTWVDAQGNEIDPDDLPDIYKENGVEVGLFDVLGPEDEETIGYTLNGSVYTVTFTDDSGVTRTYVYDDSGETPILTYTEVTGVGTTISGTDDKADSEGRVVDKDGYVVAWLDGESLHIRMDKQTLSDANDWYYAWELLDPEGKYEVLELSESSSYSMSSTSKCFTSYNYWSIIGDAEIEYSFEAGETLQVILTEAAQEASNTLGDTKDAMGWVIVATENGITTQQVEFSQIAELQENKNESSGQTSYTTVAGVTSQSEINALGSGAIWYVMDAETQSTDLFGSELEDFHLYCVINGTRYYLTLQGSALTVTRDAGAAGAFCYDSLGELLVLLSDGSTERVEIQADGTIIIGDAELGAAKDDIRIYTLQETKTKGTAFTAINTFFTWKSVDADNDGDFDDNGEDVYLGETLTYEISYFNGCEDEATVKITDVLDKGLTYVDGSAGEYATYDEVTRTITWEIPNVESMTGGEVTFKATVNMEALHEDEVSNKATVTIQVGNDYSITLETNEVDNPVPSKEVDIHEDGTYDDDGLGVQIGDTLTYRIHYFNGYTEDDQANGGVRDIIITDTLDTGLTYVEESAGKNATYDEGTRTITWVVEGVAPQTGGHVTFQAVVNETATVRYEVENTAFVKVGNDPEVQTNTIRNPIRIYFPIDEEIIPEGSYNDRSKWVKKESVNEYYAIQIEMSTYLPIIDINELLNGEFTMNFHEELDSALVLDEADTDFSVYIGGEKIDHDYYTITLASGANPSSIISMYSNALGDDCTFHVDVDLTGLAQDGFIKQEDLRGNTEIMIVFFADLEGTGLNSSYTSTVWYEVWDGGELQYTSNVDVVSVYTYEVDIVKVDSNDGGKLSGATFGVYYDEAGENPVSRNGADYEETTDEEGKAVFFGLAEGTYYIREITAPEGYVLMDDAIEVELGENLDGFRYNLEIANEPDSGNVGSSGRRSSSGGSSGNGGGVRPGTNSGPGADSVDGGSSESDFSSESHDIITADELGGLPATGESNMTAILFGLCAVFVILLAVLIYVRRRTTKDQPELF